MIFSRADDNVIDNVAQQILYCALGQSPLNTRAKNGCFLGSREFYHAL